MIRSITRLALAAALAGAALPAAAEGGGQFVLTVHGGANRYDAYGLKSGLDQGGATGSDSSKEYGAMVRYRGDVFTLGVIGDVTRPNDGGNSTAFGVVAGLGFPLPFGLRVEGLGEIGARIHGDVLKDANVVGGSTSDAWLAYVGLRPMASMEFGELYKLVVGAYGYARWDVTSKDVTVTLGDASNPPTTYKLGGAQFGLGLQVGVAF